MAKQSTLTVGKSGYALGIKRSDAEYDQLWQDSILPALVNGATMQSQRELYGRSEPIRQACRRAGFTSISEAIRVTRNGQGTGTLKTIKVKGVSKAVLAKRVHEARVQGDSWNTLRLRTAMDRDDLVALLAAHGYDGVTTGRVITTERGKAALAKREAEAAAATRKPRRTRKSSK